LYLSIYSIWELAKKVEKGQLGFDRPLDEWLDEAIAVEGLQVIDLTRTLIVDSCRLPQPFHGDPADQVIVATTRSLSGILVTKDQRLRDYSGVRTAW
jgi:PIN domain nuclease of toxin-antitoxin system